MLHPSGPGKAVGEICCDASAHTESSGEERRAPGFGRIGSFICLASDLPGETHRQEHKWGKETNAPLDRHTDPASEADSHGGQVLAAFLAELFAANGD